MVAHDPESAGRHGDIEGLLGRFRARIEVGLVQGATVDGDPAERVAAHDMVTTDPDHALDEVLVARRRHAKRGADVVEEPSDRVARRVRGEFGTVLPRRGPRKTTISPRWGSRNR